MNLKPPFDRITVEPGKLGGQPCIRHIRITVRRVLEILATYPERAELFRDYPELEEEDLQQALAFAAATVDDVCREYEAEIEQGCVLTVGHRGVRIRRLPLGR